MELISPPKATPGRPDRRPLPAFAAPGAAPAIHEQAMRRLADLTGLVPVEYPDHPPGRRLRARARRRRQRRLRRSRDPRRPRHHRRRRPDHRDPAPRRRPRPSGPEAVPRHQRQHQPAQLALDPRRRQLLRRLDPGAPRPRARRRRRSTQRSLRAALLTGERLEITDPGESEDVGVDWADPQALSPSSATASRPSRGRWAGPRAIGHRPHLGRLHRSHAVDPDRGPLPVRPRGARTAACCCSRRRRSSSRPARSAGSSGHWASAASSAPSTRSWSPVRRSPTSRPAPAAERSGPARRAAARRGRRGGDALQPRGRRLRRRRRSATPGRSGSCPTAARSPSTARSSGSSPTTPRCAVQGLDRVRVSRT